MYQLTRAVYKLIVNGNNKTLNTMKESWDNVPIEKLKVSPDTYVAYKLCESYLNNVHQIKELSEMYLSVHPCDDNVTFTFEHECFDCEVEFIFKGYNSADRDSPGFIEKESKLIITPCDEALEINFWND